MKVSKRLQAEREFVERSLGDSSICADCNATLSTYGEACTAGLSDQCHGFIAIEQAKKDFRSGAAV